MQKMTTALETPLREQLDRLAAFEPGDAPVLSLYLNMRTDNTGRANYESFLRKTFADRSRALTGSARKSFDRSVERITAYLGEDVRRTTNGLAVFASTTAKGDFFEAVQLDVPLDEHWLFIGSVPHLFPLARLNDQYPRYAALLVDTNSARLFVFGLGSKEAQEQVTNEKTRRNTMGGWSQARYQRRIENVHLHHMKEVVTVLDRVVRDEHINHIVIACDDVARPTLLEQLPQHLVEKIVDTVSLDIRTPEHQVLAQTLDALRAKDAETDVEHVEALLDGYRSGGLGVVGPEDTLQALTMGQVEELLITATPDALRRVRKMPADSAPGSVEVDTSASAAGVDAQRIKLADELVTKAQQTSARIRFIEDAALLDKFGGVGALLRFRI